jgi:hypothetical protein
VSERPAASAVHMLRTFALSLEMLPVAKVNSELRWP